MHRSKMLAIILSITLGFTVSASGVGEQRKRLETPLEKVVSTTLSSSLGLVEAAASRPLRGDPDFDVLGGELSTMKEDWRPSELVRPQVLMFRTWATMPNGQSSIAGNTLKIYAVAPSGSGKNFCFIDIDFAYDQYSSLMSGQFTVQAIIKALREEGADHLQVANVAASSRVLLADKSLGNPSGTGMSMSYNAEFGTYDVSVANLESGQQEISDLNRASTEIERVASCVAHSLANEAVHLTPDDKPEQPRLNICQLPCIVSGKTTFRHPTWGEVDLLSIVNIDSNEREAHIVAVDRNFQVRWRYDTEEWAELSLASDVPDRVGNIFLKYNPGRYDGVVVLRPTAGGFEDFHTLPAYTDGPYKNYDGRFYGAHISDANLDGSQEIVQQEFSCDPACAPDLVYAWNGSDYSVK